MSKRAKRRRGKKEEKGRRGRKARNEVRRNETREAIIVKTAEKAMPEDKRSASAMGKQAA
jgi:hypothetical protein